MNNKTESEKNTISLMGMPGETQELIACNHFEDPKDERNVGGPAGLPGKYQVTFLFERPGFHEIKEYEFSFTTRLKGNSHLAITKPAFTPPDNPNADQIKISAASPDGDFEFTGVPNSEGFLGKILSSPFDAVSRIEAQQRAYYALLPALSNWSVHLDIPLHVEVIETTELRTGNAGIRIVQPFLPAPFAVEGNPPELNSEFAHYASMYKEALNSNSPAYRFLCLFKIIEGINFRRARLGSEARECGREFSRPVEKIPDGIEESRIWLDSLFPVNARWDEATLDQIFPTDTKGKRISQLISEFTQLRDEIAHGIMRSGELALSADDLMHLRRVNNWLPLTRCIARQMLKNEFPDQFLYHLKEDRSSEQERPHRQEKD